MEPAKPEDLPVLITALIAIVGYFRSSKPRLAGLFKLTPELKERRPWLIALALFGLGTALQFAGVGMTDDESTAAGHFLEEIIEGSLISAVIAAAFMCLIVPLVEELLFRGYGFAFFLSFNRKWVTLIGGVLVSALFAFAHTNSVVHFSTGLALAWLRYSQKTILGSLAFHVVWNTTLMCLALAAWWLLKNL